MYRILLLLLLSSLTHAQNYNLKLECADTSMTYLLQNIPSTLNLKNAEQSINYFRNLIPLLQNKGFLCASIDQLLIGENDAQVTLFLGPQYEVGVLSFKQLPAALLAAVGVDSRNKEGRPLTPNTISLISEKILKWSENNGFPFAQVSVDSIVVKEKKLYGNIKWYPDKKQLIDTILINENVNISRSYLMHYLDLKQGQLYNEEKFKSISKLINALPFLEEVASPIMKFKLFKNELLLNLKDKKSNQLNALIGLTPNTQNTKQFLLTMDASMAFQNIFGRGEQFAFTYQKLQYKSPKFKMDILYPYLLNTAIGVEFHFDYFRQDTTYRKTALQIGGRYQLSAQDYIRVFYENNSNRLITIDTATVKNTHRLPNIIDANLKGFGTELTINKTDYNLNPKKGWFLSITANTLQRTIKPNDAIIGLSDTQGFDYSKIYDTLAQQKIQYHLLIEFSHYDPIVKQLVLKSTYQMGWVNSNHLFLNELYQIGGFKLLRGFDEHSIFTNQYHLISFELRYIINKNSHFQLFSDNAWVQSNFLSNQQNKWYNGLGMGTTLQTKSGLFSISYAIGGSTNQPLQLKQSKIHFGYIAQF